MRVWVGVWSEVLCEGMGWVWGVVLCKSTGVYMG